VTFDRYVKQPLPDTKIWHYMSFAKFISLLDSQRLFLMQIRGLDDKFEGYIAAPRGSDLYEMMKTTRHLPNMPANHTVVSCWSMSERESDTMWGRHVGANEGVAIQSTARKLVESLEADPLSRTFNGIVEYCDPPEPPIEPGPEGVCWEVNCFYKGTSYVAEREFRILRHASDLNLANEQGGMYVPVVLDQLIEKIYVRPKSPKWTIQLVKSLAKGYSISADVLPSELDLDPLA
jgi:hypothetical protein